MNKILGILVWLVFFSTSCGISKKTRDTKRSINASKQIIEQTFNQQVEAEWLTTRAKINLESGTNRLGGAGWVTLKRDSALMISARKFGFEIAKIKITPDSVIFLNRLQSEYYSESFIKGAASIGLPPNFNAIQELILGNLPSEVKENSKLSLSQDTLRLVKETDKQIIFSTLNATAFTISEMGFVDKKSGILVQQTLSNYQPFQDSILFALDRNLTLKTTGDSEIKISMSFQQPVWNNPSDLALTIPKSYNRAEF
ncbi:MAG: DUF4292 domain-containing protein [Saprospiraceae bacterium]|jgi:hypothetical protein